MNIELWTIGKESNKHLESATNLYINRLNHYTRFQLLTIDNSKINKNLPLPQLLEKEALLVLQKLNDKDTLVCLDDKGKAFSSVQFSEKIEPIVITFYNKNCISYRRELWDFGNIKEKIKFHIFLI
ncbi:MAG: rRNA large subunit methyltransferase [Bacteroidetes bacterium OLB11]|nr:MAG: rRNA large subunit methyltransferase [Bacteroidetes bacterium OLB11]